MQWVALPVIGDVDREIVRLVLDSISRAEIMQSFFINTSIRKAAQAQDFVDATNALDGLPKDASNEDYLAAEKYRMVAFRNFVTATN